MRCTLRQARTVLLLGATVGLTLGVLSGALAAQALTVQEGQRVRIWGASQSQRGAPEALTGKIRTLTADSIEIATVDGPYTVPRSSVQRVEQSIGHPHAWRNAGYTLGATFLIGTVVNAIASRGCGSDGMLGADFCFNVGEGLVVLPVSILAAVVAGTTSAEAFTPAVLPAQTERATSDERRARATNTSTRFSSTSTSARPGERDPDA